MTQVRILVADDHPILRKGLRTILKVNPNWKVIAEASNGREAVEKARQLRPDITILDISMPELNGLDASRLIVKAQPRARVLILTMHSDEDLIAKALQSGARAYVLKSEAERDLLSAVEAVLEGRTFLPRECYSAVLSSQRRRDAETGRLSMREAQVVHLLAEGRRNKEIAAELGISTRTAENHRARIMEKLNAHSLSELVRYAIRNKMMEA